MSGGLSKKRDAGDYRRRHDRNKFRRVTNPALKHTDITGGLNGIVFTCVPHHEHSAVREGVLLLTKHYEELTQTDPSAKTHAANSTMKDLDDELKGLRSKGDRPFTHLEVGVLGAVFLRVNTEKVSVSLETLVECALKNARATESPHTKNCVRILPIHNTCYASPEKAAQAAVTVVKQHFPALTPRTEPEDATSNTVSTASFAIAFRARMNTGAHRQEYITTIAEAIHQFDDRYTVNLTKPDVTLIVEIFKTNCCIGTFRQFFELAKMNLREAACPSVPKKNGNGEKDATKAAKETGATDVAEKKVEQSPIKTLNIESNAAVVGETVKPGVKNEVEVTDTGDKMENGVKDTLEVKDGANAESDENENEKGIVEIKAEVKTEGEADNNAKEKTEAPVDIKAEAKMGVKMMKKEEAPTEKAEMPNKSESKGVKPSDSNEMG